MPSMMLFHQQHERGIQVSVSGGGNRRVVSVIEPIENECARIINDKYLSSSPVRRE